MKQNILYKNFKNTNLNLIGFVIAVVLIVTSSLFAFTLDKQINVSRAKSEYVNASWVMHTDEPDGSGTKQSPYLISNAQELAYLIPLQGQIYAKLTNQIDLAAYNWLPIGYNTSSNVQFNSKVNLDGNGYRIKNLKVNMPTVFDSTYSMGLYGKVENGVTIENIILEGYVIGYGNVGGIVGEVNQSATIKNSQNHAIITSYGAYAGGIAGNSAQSTIQDCYNFGTVNLVKNIQVDRVFAGGIAGQGLKILNCFNSSNITLTSNVAGGKAYCAGIVGRVNALGSSLVGQIDKCSNQGEITSSGTTSNLLDENYSAGIVGDVADSTIINQCTSNGDVTSNNVKKLDSGVCNDYAGGIFGYGYKAEMTECFATGQVIGVGQRIRKTEVVANMGYTTSQETLYSTTAPELKTNNIDSQIINASSGQLANAGPDMSWERDEIVFIITEYIPTYGNMYGYTTNSTFENNKAIKQQNNFSNKTYMMVDYTINHYWTALYPSHNKNWREQSTTGHFFTVNWSSNNGTSSFALPANVDSIWWKNNLGASQLFDKYNSINGFYISSFQSVPNQDEVVFNHQAGFLNGYATANQGINVYKSSASNYTNFAIYITMKEDMGGYTTPAIAFVNLKCYNDTSDMFALTKNPSEKPYDSFSSSQLKALTFENSTPWTINESVNNGYPVLKHHYWAYA